ncbi:MAG: class I SAM-dependent methyltransferase [Candidatus Cloacimonetes bacterium]|nr:class I SAM-dependent methyltransferase [Bacteroidota bacterium]MBL7149268.1 class I SAM-dependent methyltransferase [Candidatus Cloacimonadota bacterium]
MQYDKIKDKFAGLINKIPFFRRLFYLLLDMLLLRQWYVKREIKKHFPKGKPVRFYDAGAGFGQYSYFVLKYFKKAKVHAVDLKTDYMDSFTRYAAKHIWIDFTAQQADLTAYIPKDKFNLILAIDILEHIENDEQVLRNFREVLHKCGKLIISSPSTFDESAKFTAEHVRPGYLKEEIISKLENTGFKIVSFDYSYGKWGHLAWLLTMKYPMNLLGISKLFFLLLPFYYLLFYPLSALFMLFDLNAKNKIGTGVIVVVETTG